MNILADCSVSLCIPLSVRPARLRLACALLLPPLRRHSACRQAEICSPGGQRAGSGTSEDPGQLVWLQHFAPHEPGA